MICCYCCSSFALLSHFLTPSFFLLLPPSPPSLVSSFVQAFAPTLYINGKQLNATQFTISVKEICDAYTGTPKPQACSDAPAPQGEILQQAQRCAV